jgi:hypothetical protein
MPAHLPHELDGPVGAERQNQRSGVRANNLSRE